MKVILAHGALGPFDEVMVAVTEIMFVLAMVYGWIRARKASPDRHLAEDDAAEHEID